ncbi:response regulator [Phototrophicus methaneseepsis]|uniref:Response regulator n=1 Tax=Phototrophicus methaneseepsis TaxID=2710758 RepID=A0A7S8E5B8_9CHLR|nr:response regulator [Phototrophicus methaneseepsis]QPC80588.1 response regulator [Phototrophicus methaneseepsis]
MKRQAHDDGNDTIDILLVDDIQDARDGIQRLLSFEQDFRVVGTASNGREGVALAQEHQPDIVIMDINMPDMDGLEAASRITKALPFVGVIMMSVQDDPDYMQRAMLAGARFFLSKPPSTDQLYSTIRNVYEQYSPIRERFRRMNDPSALLMDPTEENRPDDGTRAGHIVVVYSPSGGTGCTTIATNLASGLMKEDVKTLLVDADLEFGDVGTFLDLRSQSTISELADKTDDLDAEYFDSIVATHNSGIRVLLSPSLPNVGADIRELNPDAVTSIIEQIRYYYDFVVVDTSCNIDAVVASLLEIATKIVLVVTPTLPAIKNVKLVLDLLTKSDVSNDKVALVVNKAIENPSRNQRAHPTPERISNYLKMPVVGSIPLSEEYFILNAINKGVPVIAMRDPNKPIVKRLLELADTIYSDMMGSLVEEAETEKPKEKRGLFSFGNR